MTSRELIRWSRLHERRARSVPSLVPPVVIGALLAAWVGWRSIDGPVAASHAWLAGALLAYAVAFMRVPFHIYWRSDAALLAQLPIEGGPLLDAALLRCMRAGAAITAAALIGLAPMALVADAGPLLVRHALLAVGLGLATALLLPGVTIGAAALVVHGSAVLRTATALGGAPARTAPADAPAGPPTSPAAILGALPGFAASVVLVSVLFAAPWLLGEPATAPGPIVLAALAGVSIAAVIIARTAGGDVMARVLRDVSALDRQRLASLEIKAATPIEAAIARMLDAARLSYLRDVRLMRRRYPMAFAIGALVFGVLVIVGLARPSDATPWLAVAVGGAAVYGVVLEARMRRPPIELSRLSATLPITAAARAHAKLAWLAGWWTVFAGAPAVFAALRQPAPTTGLVLAGVGSLVMFVAGAMPR